METFYFVFSGVQDATKEFPQGYIFKKDDLDTQLKKFLELLIDVQIGTVYAPDYDTAYRTAHFGI